MTRLHLGISTCPNDTFAFHAILAGRIDAGDLDIEVELLDVQRLNERLAAGDFDIAKGSFHAALRLADRIGVLPVGAALGFGVGPLLLAAREGDVPEASRPSPARVLCPGRWTTAALLYDLFHPDAGEVEHVVFDQIMPALRAGRADFGVCIHEGRFTYRDHGLALVEDLGERWERATGALLPLGGLLARKSLDPDVRTKATDLIRRSLAWAREHPEDAMESMRRHAQELSDDVIRSHVDLYVNEWTDDLGIEGRMALTRLADKAREAGVLGGEPLTVY